MSLNVLPTDTAREASEMTFIGIIYAVMGAVFLCRFRRFSVPCRASPITGLSELWRWRWV
jgi:hypothetical protein